MVSRHPFWPTNCETLQGAFVPSKLLCTIFFMWARAEKNLYFCQILQTKFDHFYTKLPVISSGLREEGSEGLVGRPPSQWFDPLPTQRVPFELFWDIHFWLTDPRVFLNAPSVPIYTNFEWGSKFSNKMSKNVFFGFFFQKFAGGLENFFKMGSSEWFGKAQKKKVEKISDVFLKILDPTLPVIQKLWAK